MSTDFLWLDDSADKYINLDWYMDSWARLVVHVINSYQCPIMRLSDTKTVVIAGFKTFRVLYFQLWWHCIRTIVFLSCGNVKEKASNLLPIFTYHPLWFDLFFWIFDDELLFLVKFRSCIAVIVRHHGRVAKLHHFTLVLLRVWILISDFILESIFHSCSVTLYPCFQEPVFYVPTHNQWKTVISTYIILFCITFWMLIRNHCAAVIQQKVCFCLMNYWSD